ncbi:MAG TPA: hypothetical protein VGL61_00985 [Kofleriaceae bacterium]|jgi:hypothetical protein
MRIVIATCLAISAPAFADRPAPPKIAVSSGEEIEIPRSSTSSNLGFKIVPGAALDTAPKTSCALTQGSHHIDGTDDGEGGCTVQFSAHAGFVPGAATYSGRINVNGEWSEPGSAELTLVMPGNMWMQSSSSQNLIWTGLTNSATLAKGKLSFPLFTQNASDGEPDYPFLGRITVTVPPNGKIDQLVPLDARWLDMLAQMPGWKKYFHHQADALLAARTVHVTGTYTTREGAELTIEVPGINGLASMGFRPSGYKVDVNFIDCDKLSAAQRRAHSICE